MNAPLDIQVAHVLQRRIRIVVPALKGDRERFYLLEILLRKRPAIREVRSECRIGSLTIHFNPA
ncbi:MAG: HMA2 domain-containing protein, partial [Azonexus sp.]